MGSYNGVEICELVGLHLLEELTNTIPKESVGLYRDDGVASPSLRSTSFRNWIGKKPQTINYQHNNSLNMKQTRQTNRGNRPEMASRITGYVLL